MIFARASKCVSRAEIIAYGKHNLKKFQKMGMFMNGIPSEPTIWRIEYGINELVMADKMRVFAELFNQKLLEKYCGMEIICIDGKAERGTVQENGRNPDIVSAYSFNTGITLVVCKV